MSNLEQFVRDDVEAAGGAWDEIEPQVYDLLLTPGNNAANGAANDIASVAPNPSVLRVTFDPEALAEHPQAQLASLGTPLIDGLLASALERGRFVELHLLGQNMRPHQLDAKVRRGIKLADGLSLDIQRVRPVDFPQIVFWFEASFFSDQQEQEILSAAVDLHYGRQVRRLEALLDDTRLSETRSAVLPEAPGIGRTAAYGLAREEVLRTVESLANLRARDLNKRLATQTSRMTRYYDDLAHELEAQAHRGRAAADTEKFESRRGALAQERAFRIAELRKQCALRAQLRLLLTLVVHQPKLQIQATVVNHQGAAAKRPAENLALSLVWDPLNEALEAVPCSACRRPTLELTCRQSALVCPACLQAPPPARRIPR